MIHNIRYRLFVYKGEDEKILTEGLKNILPTAKPEKTIAEGMKGDNITILSGNISKKSETKKFMKDLLSIDEFEIKKLISELDKKMDKNGNLFLRLSKYDACEDNLKISDKGDTIHLKIKIAAYPAKKKIAMQLLNEFFNENNI